MASVGPVAAERNGHHVEPLPYVGFNQLRSFHAVATAGSVTKAAQLLHISQPTVTIQLRQLEKAYGVELVHRTPKGLRLTDVGKALFALSEQIFALEQDAVNLLTEASGALIGELRVSGVGPYFVMLLLSSFTRRHPSIRLSLNFGNSTEVIKAIKDYRTDVGVVGLPVGEAPPHSPLVWVPFSRQQVVIFVHCDHPWAARDGVTLEELSHEPLIVREPGSVSRRALEEALAARDLKLNPAFEVSREGVWEAVAAGLGAGMTTEVELPPDDRLHMLPIVDAQVETDAYVVSLRERQRAPLIRTLMDFAAEVATDQGVAATEH